MIQKDLDNDKYAMDHIGSASSDAHVFKDKKFFGFWTNMVLSRWKQELILFIPKRSNSLDGGSESDI